MKCKECKTELYDTSWQTCPVCGSLIVEEKTTRQKTAETQKPARKKFWQKIWG